MIYFIQPSQGGAIKIGRANNVLDRFAALQANSPVELKLIAAIPGHSLEEKMLHRKFANSRLHGEWFESSEELTNYIANLPPMQFKNGQIENNTLPVLTIEPIIKMYMAGYSMSDIGSIFGVSRQRIHQIYSESGNKPTQDRPRRPFIPIAKYYADLLNVGTN